MREVEFRGKRVDNGEWVYGHLIQGQNSYIVTHKQLGDSVVTRAYSEKHISTFCHQVIPESVGQYIDMNSEHNKIYEDDYIGNDTTHNLQVIYDKGHPSIKFIDMKREHIQIITQKEIDDEMLTIIGNIHDNPEIIK